MHFLAGLQTVFADINTGQYIILVSSSKPVVPLNIPGHISIKHITMKFQLDMKPSQCNGDATI